MNCCDSYGNCNQGHDCPVRTTKYIGFYDVVIRGLTALGVFAAIMFMLGYAYASVPLVAIKTCTPSFIDRIIK